jgi:hypothetical protein
MQEQMDLVRGMVLDQQQQQQEEAGHEEGPDQKVRLLFWNKWANGGWGL